MAGKYAKKQKRPWIAAVLPWKGDRAGEAIRKIVFLVALITFLVTGGILLWEMVIQPAMVDNKANYVQQIYHADDSLSLILIYCTYCRLECSQNRRTVE